jgi:hypothetical protein
MPTIRKPSNDSLSTKSILSVFLAGSIEMGKAVDWQTDVSDRLADFEGLQIYNPRRDDWDSSWKQEESNPQFNHQVNWELNRLEEADIIFMNFCSGTQSPITLMELGLFADRQIIVVCPKDFWRRGNIEIVCTRYRIPLFENLEEGLGALKTLIWKRS